MTTIVSKQGSPTKLSMCDTPKLSQLRGAPQHMQLRYAVLG
jgi:hypothetical protein